MRIFKGNKVYDFMGARHFFIALSLLVVSGSLLLMWKPGPKWSTDFRGGTEVEIAFLQPVNEDQIREAVQEAGFDQPEVIRVTDTSNANHFLLRVQEVSAISEEKKGEIERALCFGEGANASDCPDGSKPAEVKVSPGGEKITVRYESDPDLARIGEQMAKVHGIEMRESSAERQSNPFLQNAREHKVEIQLKSKGDQVLDGLKRKLGAQVVPDAALRVEWIGPKAGQQLRDAALKSIAIAMVFVMVYIAFRFDLRFAPGAVFGLVHDAVATVGVLVLMGREISLITVAALLTVVGYSVNDTVVVYDRVRENLGKLRGTTFIQIINLSLSEMLGRTILTASTVVFSLVAFFLWGTGALKDFALALIIGTVLGTYSSIYVALPLTYWLDQRFFGNMPRSPSGPRPKKDSAVL
ncbi:MAG TPA: protein translocase subunit SecF [Polyangiaceae bacterium]|nr:protein translocase subunit SecF [Polyangiaceae bacterium]